ncbi:hypothetical protein PHISCL_06539 [Aspergillus sclerotialis]|uniref:RNA polymerase II Elongator complex associated protein Kti12 n=1 Tax=Aspergillus sclerotialis TaxID=2070753 RepID=A0A3A2ZP22_9EURO|nr:hypothetical protein PHISCL_06539 [Aspergillus sclerotialis]
MPLIILSGYPCSGLTHRAQQIAASFEKTQEDLLTSDPPVLKNRYKIHIIPTHDAAHPRTVYDNARTEKEARGVAYTRAKRLLGKNTIVILDGMNYIKGYRYQLWCEAKEAGTSCCVVHVGTPVDKCVENNDARIRRRKGKKAEHGDGEGEGNVKGEENGSTTPAPSREDTEGKEGPGQEGDDEEPYPPDLLHNLIFRYEEPSPHSRWDKPLFTVPWFDPEPPIVDIWTALTGIPHPSLQTESPSQNPTPSLTSDQTTQPSDTASIATLRTGLTGTTAGGRGLPTRTKIKPHAATVQPAQTGTNDLYNLEKRTSAIVTAIRNFTLSTPSAEAALAQSSSPSGISITVPESETPVFIPAHVATTGTTDELAGAGGILALPRLQRLRRQWIGLNRVAYAGGGRLGAVKVDDVPGAFVRFLNAEFEGRNVE